MNTQTPSPRRRRGFTLIELLTVIAIIGILAAILIPVVGHVRMTGRASRSNANLREIHRAVMMYAQENRDRLPHAGANAAGISGWHRQIAPYLGLSTTVSEAYANFYANPNAPVYPPTAEPYSTYSAHPLLNQGNRSYPTSIIRSPSRLIIIGDGEQRADTLATGQFTGAWWEVNRGGLPNGVTSPDTVLVPPSGGGKMGFHNGGKASMLRMDGSLKTGGPQSFTYGEFAYGL